MMNFKLLQKLVDELNSTNSTIDKEEILRKPEYDDFQVRAAIRATYNPFKQYYVTPTNLKKRSDLITSNNYDLFDLLAVLSSRTLTGHDAIAAVNGFIENNKEYAELIYNIFDRNLKTRTSDKIINKIFPDLIPTFDVALAKKYEDHMKKVNFDNGFLWLASRKLDGLRCIAIIDDAGDIVLYSRTGTKFQTLQLVIDALKNLNLRSVVFDGEICIVEADGKENFPAIQSEWNKKDYTISNPRYKIFDMMTLEEFSNKKGDKILSDRLVDLNSTIPLNNSVLSVVEQMFVWNEAHLQELRDMARKLGWEGIMIRKNIGYDGKRSDKLLKCKLFQDAEYEVVDVVMGKMRVIVRDENDKTYEVEEEMLSNVVIMHKDNPVDVGSGFSQEQRRHYYLHPEEIIGSEITVQYFEESKDKNGKLSLRFPTVKAIWKGKRNV
jgi:DNA ligase 1